MVDLSKKQDPLVNTLPDGQGVSPLALPNPVIPKKAVPPKGPLPDQSKSVVLPSLIVRGRIQTALAALNMYQVNLGGMGTATAQYVSSAAGSNIFRLASTMTATLSPGVEVWVALDPVNNGQAFIIGTAHTDAPLKSDTRTLSQYPQVAGLEFNPKTKSPDQMDAKIGAAAKQASSNYNPGLADAVPGDWAVTNYQGGGVGVEAFRVWIGGGPMLGITFFCDEQTTRVAGTGLELITMAEEYEDRLMGRSLVSIRRRVDFPSDSLLDNPPNLLETRGQTYAGESKFQSYRPKDNPGQNPEYTEDKTAGERYEVQRAALIHEYKGVDGTYVLTAAASLTLQKWVGVLMPIEVVSRPEEKPVKDFPAVVADSDAEDGTLKFPKPVKVIPEREAITGSKDVSLISGSAILSRPRDESNPLQGVSNAADIAASAIGWQAARAFVNTNMWKIVTGAPPQFMLKGDGNEADLRPIDELNTDPGMWKRVPKFFALNLNSYGASKRFYVGRAVISITDEGGILMQDAWGSQLLMSGGNIYLTAEHSIIRNAGRDNTDLSGRDHVSTAGRNIDFCASSGSASLIAGAQLTLVGGQSGDHGVLIHSKGTGSSMLMNGKNGAYAADSEGIVLRSDGGITAAGKAVRLVGMTGPVGISSKAGLLVEAGDMSAAFTPTGMWLGDGEGAVMLSPKGSTMPLLAVTTNLVIYGLSNMLTNASALYTYQGSPVATLKEKVGALTPSEVAPEAEKGLFPGYLASEDYGAEDEGYFLPEPAWQVRLRLATEGNQLQKKYTWKGGEINGSRPFPGKEYWDKSGFFKMAKVVIKNYTDNYESKATPAIERAPLSGMLKGV
jgi:hypothetical protein